jgi:hypothetical protein
MGDHVNRLRVSEAVTEVNELSHGLIALGGDRVRSLRLALMFFEWVFGISGPAQST